MATTFKSGSYDGRYLQLDLTQNGANIDWTLSSIGGDEPCYTVHKLLISIDGNTVMEMDKSSASDGKFPAAKGSQSGSVFIGYERKTVTVVFNASVYYNSTKENGGTFDFKTVANISINKNGTWEKGLTWIKNDGTWKKGVPWKKVNGVWQKGGA